MKNVLVLGAVAVVLFSLSAALSLWLNQTRQAAADAAKKDDDKTPKKLTGEDPGKDKDKTPGKAPPTVDPKLSDPGARVDAMEDRLRRRESQMDLVLRDLQGERQAMDDLYRQVTAATKAAAARAAEAEEKGTVVPAKGTAAPEADAAAEKKNADQLSRLYAAMTPESAAPILKQMADGGRLDTAVRIIAGMPDRNAAQLLDRISQTDAGLASQITDRILRLRRAPAGGAKAP